jgi:hypothetical protein
VYIAAAAVHANIGLHARSPGSVIFRPNISLQRAAKKNSQCQPIFKLIVIISLHLTKTNR